MVYNPTEVFNRSFLVWYGMSGTSTGYPNYREGAWGSNDSSFTWVDWVTGDTPNHLYDWSLKKWYQWGARKFALHTPFGRPMGGTEAYLYQVDQYLNAKYGLIQNGVVENYPCPWMTRDFVSVWRALINGEKGSLPDDVWDTWTGEWYDPDDPIEVTGFLGVLWGPTGSRFNKYFEEDEQKALQRLQDSFEPLIVSGMKIGADAMSVMPGPKYKSYLGPSVSLTEKSQRGWWNFFQWMVRQVGLKNIYGEAYPLKNYTNPSFPPIVFSENPYVGCCFMSEEFIYDKDYGQFSYYHSDLGKIDIINSWQNWRPITRLANGSPGKHYYLLNYEDSQYSSSDPANPNNYYVSANSLSNLYGAVCDYGAYAYLMNEQPMQSYDTNPQNIRLKFTVQCSPFFLQNYSFSARYNESFLYKFPHKNQFIDYLQWTKNNQDYNPGNYVSF